ncbi:MAG: cytochrome c biogenesis CcdA family protein [Sphingomonadales bacterium]|jgi:cytochrome c biogenesis protein CcdA
MSTIALAFLAGVLTTLNPCVLPMLPLVFSGAFAQSNKGPLILASGLVLSFTTLGVVITAFGHGIGLDIAMIRIFAAILLLLSGLLLSNQQAQNLFAKVTAPIANGANSTLNSLNLEGRTGQFTLGLLLGAVWSPCVGPTLGAAMALAAQGEALGDITITMAVFSFGMASVFLLIAYGSRQFINSKVSRLQLVAKKARPIFGWLLILLSALILTGFDKVLEAQLITTMPDWLIVLTTRY